MMNPDDRPECHPQPNAIYDAASGEVVHITHRCENNRWAATNGWKYCNNGRLFDDRRSPHDLIRRNYGAS